MQLPYITLVVMDRLLLVFNIDQNEYFFIRSDPAKIKIAKSQYLKK